MPFHPNEPVRIGAKAISCPVHVTASQQVRVTARQCDCVKREQGGSRPLAMQLLFLLICTLVHRGEDFNEHMIAAEPEGGGFGGHAGGGALEFMGEQGATR